MCDPTIALAVAGQAVSLFTQSQAANAERDYQNKLMIQRQQEMELNQQLANQSAALEQTQINQQVAEKDVESSQQIQDNAIAAMEARAAAKVSSGETAGISVAALLSDISNKEARFANSVRQNQEGFAINAEARKEAAEQKRQGRVASVQPYIPAPVQGPDYAGALMTVGGAAIDWWNKKQSAPTGTKKT